MRCVICVERAHAPITRRASLQPVATQTEFKRVAVKHMSHPVDVVAGVVTLIPYVATTKFIDVIEFNQAQLLRQ